MRRPNELTEKLNQENIQEGTFEALELDLMSMDSVKSFAKQILDKNIKIDVLINNAGIMFGSRKETQDGFESQLATNYLGHFLLTHLLLPKLKEAGKSGESARIINVSSAAHHGGCWLDWNDFQSKYVLHNVKIIEFYYSSNIFFRFRKFYQPEGAYCISKAAQVMMTIYLDQKLSSLEDTHVKVSAVHPGIVKTDLYVNVRYMTVSTEVSVTSVGISEFYAQDSVTKIPSNQLSQ